MFDNSYKNWETAQWFVYRYDLSSQIVRLKNAMNKW
jgi:hypothetical protein